MFRLFILLWSAVPLVIHAQTLVAECIHYDANDRVIYLEREFEHADTMVYFMAYADGGRQLRVFEQWLGDTLVETYRCYDHVVDLIPSTGSGEIVISQGDDSMKIMLLGFQLEVIWDTSFLLSEGQRFLELDRRVRKEFARLVHEGELLVELNSGSSRETWKYMTYQGRTLSKYIMNGNGRVVNRQLFTRQDRSLVAFSYFDSDTIAYAVDSIFWDVDTSRVRVINQWMDNGDRYEYELIFRRDTTFVITGTDTVIDHWVYDNSPWHVRFREASLREGPLCHSRLRRARESLLHFSLTPGGNGVVNEHEWDPVGRLVRTIVFRNGELERRIEYRYF